MKKKIYRTVITLVVLSEQPIPEEITAVNILDIYTVGDRLIVSESSTPPTELIGKTAVIEIEKAGCYSEFFDMDSQGNDLEEFEPYSEIDVDKDSD